MTPAPNDQDFRLLILVFFFQTAVSFLLFLITLKFRQMARHRRARGRKQRKITVSRGGIRL